MGTNLCDFFLDFASIHAPSEFLRERPSGGGGKGRHLRRGPDVHGGSGPERIGCRPRRAGGFNFRVEGKGPSCCQGVFSASHQRVDLVREITDGLRWRRSHLWCVARPPTFGTRGSRRGHAQGGGRGVRRARRGLGSGATSFMNPSEKGPLARAAKAFGEDGGPTSGA